MKKLLVIVMLMMAPVCMFGQKFGHINSSDLIPLMPDYTQAETEMQTIQSEYEEELKYLRTEYEKKIQDYESQEATLPENIKTRRQQEIMELQDKLTSYYQECQVNLERKQAESELYLRHKNIPYRLFQKQKQHLLKLHCLQNLPLQMNYLQLLLFQ